jgi:glucose/arabinose dehydrogenase
LKFVGEIMKRILFLSVTILCLQAFSIAEYGQGVPAPHTIRLQSFLSGLSSPVFMTNAGDGTNRLFIVQQGGIIRVLQPGLTAAPTTFLDITGPVLSGGERGLLGLAFHPQYATNRRFFVYYTRDPDGAIQISEFQASVANPNVADTTERPIITILHPNNTNHNGGTVAFGSDGYLYAGPGDGGNGNDPPNNAQNINQLLGKIIRIDPTAPGTTPAYTNPSTNPYFGDMVPGADEIYAIGMRNPYRFSFDRGGTNQLWAADVGQGAIEEIDIITLGGNYGWRAYEGTQCTNLNPQECAGGTNPINHTPPVVQYSHSAGRCSVTGGFVYRGTQGSLPLGSYVYADYCSGEIFLWHNNQQTVIDSTSTQNIVGFGEDEAGELYMVREGGPIFKITRAKASADLDGDLRTDFAVYRPSTGAWYALHSSNGSIRQQVFGGLAGDIAVPEDIDGDNITDIGYFRPSVGEWRYFRSSNSTIQIREWGVSGDMPAAGDYDGDAKTDLAVFRPSTGIWFILKSSGGEQYAFFGTAGDRPVSGDYDGDGRYDVSVFRDSDGTWYRLNSSNGGFVAVRWGLTGDVPSPGDFDGDGRLDQAVFRPSTSTWYQLRSTSGFQAMQWGLSADIPVVGDYDADARDDIGVFRPSTGTWYVLRSSNGSLLAGQFGQSGDAPVPTYDIP